MDDTISRQALLNKFEPWLKVKEYNYGELNMLKAILYEIRFMPPATDKNVGTKLSTNLAEVGTDMISRQSAISALDDEITIIGKTNAIVVKNYVQRVKRRLEQLPSTQPETAKRIVGKSRNGMTLWYQCNVCNEPVDEKDAYCRGCGRRLIDG